MNTIEIITTERCPFCHSGKASCRERRPGLWEMACSNYPLVCQEGFTGDSPTPERSRAEWSLIAMDARVKGLGL